MGYRINCKRSGKYPDDISLFWVVADIPDANFEGDVSVTLKTRGDYERLTVVDEERHETLLNVIVPENWIINGITRITQDDSDESMISIDGYLIHEETLLDSDGAKYAFDYHLKPDISMHFMRKYIFQKGAWWLSPHHLYMMHEHPRAVNE